MATDRTARRSGRWPGRATFLCVIVAVLAFGLGIIAKAVWHESRMASARRNLGDHELETRAAAVALLDKNGEDYTADLVKLLDHSDWEVRAFATESLATSRPIPNAVIPVLIANLRTSQIDEFTRCRAALYLGDYGQLGAGPISELEQSVINLLESTLSDPRDESRLCALEALLKFARRDKSIAGLIEKHSDDADEGVRLRTLLALNELGLRTAQETLAGVMHAAGSQNDAVRADATSWLIIFDLAQFDRSKIVAELEAIQARLPGFQEEIDSALFVIDPMHVRSDPL